MNPYRSGSTGRSRSIHRLVTLAIVAIAGGCGGDSPRQAGELACEQGTTRCEGRCVAVGADPAHCGGCGNVCKGGEACDMGTCTFHAPVSTWVQRFGDAQNDCGLGAAVDAAGDALVMGFFKGQSVPFGGTLLSSADKNQSADVFLAKMKGEDGTPLWAVRFEASGNELALDNEGDALITGRFSGVDVPFGAMKFTSKGHVDAFVVKVSNNDGAPRWAASLGGSEYDVGHALATDARNDVVVTGEFQGKEGDFAGPLASRGTSDVFVAKFSGETGARGWLRRFGGAGYDVGLAIATDGAGDVVVAGRFEGAPIDFGGVNLSNHGDHDIFVAKLAGSDGGVRWAKRFGGDHYDSGASLVVDAHGDVVLLGGFQGESIDFGGISLSSAGDVDMVIAKLAGTDGATRWVRRLGGPGSDSGYRVALGPEGTLLLSGSFRSRSMSLGTTTLTNSATSTAFLALLDAEDGAPRWATSFGHTGFNTVGGVAFDGKGGLLFAGYFEGENVDFGVTTLSSKARADVFVAKFSSP